MFGLHPGQSHADARAIAPDLVSAPAEPEAEARALPALALWFERFSPLVAVDAARPGQEGLLLDMTGGAHLFGGEEALLGEILRRLEAAGIPATAALADTPGAAFALARWSGRPAAVAPPGGAREALADLPVEALRLSDEAVRLLARFGLQRIGDLYPLSRAGLARRFRSEDGLALVRRLDQALGLEAEPLVPVRPAPDFRVWQVFAEPLIEPAGVAAALPPLAEALCAQLEREGQGGRVLALDAFRTDGRVVRLSAGLSAPSRAPAHLLRLLQDKGIETLDLGFGADALMLTALRAEPLAQRQAELDGGTRLGGAGEALAGLIDRLQARLGEDAVLRPQGVQSHLPEQAELWLAAGPAPPRSEAPPPPRPRPVLMFDPPEPIEALAELPDAAPSRFTWRRAAHRIAKAEGPERLAPEWWRPVPASGLSRTRDYYAVEDEAGRRFWLFREGLYDRLEADDDRLPRWWIQGVWG
jgi:protein ImuB